MSVSSGTLNSTISYHTVSSRVPSECTNDAVRRCFDAEASPDMGRLTYPRAVCFLLKDGVAMLIQEGYKPP